MPSQLSLSPKCSAKVMTFVALAIVGLCAADHRTIAGDGDMPIIWDDTFNDEQPQENHTYYITGTNCGVYRKAPTWNPPEHEPCGAVASALAIAETLTPFILAVKGLMIANISIDKLKQEDKQKCTTATDDIRAKERLFKLHSEKCTIFTLAGLQLTVFDAAFKVVEQKLAIVRAGDKGYRLEGYKLRPMCDCLRTATQRPAVRRQCGFCEPELYKPSIRDQRQAFAWFFGILRAAKIICKEDFQEGHRELKTLRITEQAANEPLKGRHTPGQAAANDVLNAHTTYSHELAWLFGEAQVNTAWEATTGYHYACSTKGLYSADQFVEDKSIWTSGTYRTVACSPDMVISYASINREPAKDASKCLSASHLSCINQTLDSHLVDQIVSRKRDSRKRDCAVSMHHLTQCLFPPNTTGCIGKEALAAVTCDLTGTTWIGSAAAALSEFTSYVPRVVTAVSNPGFEDALLHSETVTLDVERFSDDYGLLTCVFTYGAFNQLAAPKGSLDSELEDY